jgi:hypothetical protein
MSRCMAASHSTVARPPTALSRWFGLGVRLGWAACRDNLLSHPVGQKHDGSIAVHSKPDATSPTVQGDTLLVGMRRPHVCLDWLTAA